MSPLAYFAANPVSGSTKHDALEREDLGEPVEVRIAMQNDQRPVLGRSRSDQGIGDRYAVVAVSTRCEPAECAHRRIRDRSIVAQDSQRVEFALKRRILRARACGVEDLHAQRPA